MSSTETTVYKLLKEGSASEVLEKYPDLSDEVRQLLENLAVLDEDLAHPEEIFPPVPEFKLPPVRPWWQHPAMLAAAALFVVVLGLSLWDGPPNPRGPIFRGDPPPAEDLVQWIRIGDIARLQSLSEEQWSVDARDAEERPLLWHAARHNRTQVITFLLDRGADIDLVDKEGISSLMIAAQHGHLESVRLLIAKEANLTLLNEQGATAEDLARDMGFDDVVELLQQ